MRKRLEERQEAPGGEECVVSDTRALGGRVFHFALNGAGETLIQGGEGLGGKSTWSRKRGLPVIGYVAETRVGVVMGLCGMNVRKFHE